MNYGDPRDGTELGEEMVTENQQEIKKMAQTWEQRETGVRVVPTFKEAVVGENPEFRSGGRQFGKAKQARQEIIEKAFRNIAIAQEHLVEGMEWLEITGLLNTNMEERHKNLKRLISDILEDIEGLREVYVRSPEV